MTKPKISVIIPVYNEENVIVRCLQSLDKQKGANFEVILVDDGSTDKTLSTISDYKSQNYNLIILQQNHLGPATARNLGVKNSSGEVLVFVDADMTFEPNFLTELTKPIFKKGATGTHCVNEFVSNWDNRWARFWNYNQGIWGKSRIKKGNEQLPVYRAIRKSAFDKVQGFDTGGYTDDLSLVKKVGKKPRNVRSTTYFHANPDNLHEVFTQARWSAKREYKMGKLGAIYQIIKHSFPIISLKIKNPLFIIFKIVYDAGFSLGIIEYKLLGKSGAK